MGTRKALFLGLTAVLTAGVLLGGEAIPNWYAPPTWTPAQSASGGSGLTDVTSPRAFIGINPCRIADTRGLGWTGQAGPPSLNANVTRNFQITGVVAGVPAQCGIPTGAEAVSFNFAVTNITANGNLIAFPAGGAPPTVSSLNWQTGFAALSNAAVIPVSAGGAISVRVNAAASTTDLIIDVNGYYGTTPNTAGNYFSISNNSGGYSITTNNFSTTCGGTCGILASTSSGTAIEGDANGTTGYGVYGFTGATGNFWAGVIGQSTAASGEQYGVEGTLNSTNTNGCAGGVFGRAGTQFPCNFVGSAGVYGTNNTGSGGNWGVLGNSTSRGVQGSRVDSAGIGQNFGVLGYLGNSGVHSFNDITAGGTKFFVEPHPSDPSKQIAYISLEGNEAGTYFRGRGRFQNGAATIVVPEDFRDVTSPENLSIQVTPIGDYANVAVQRIGLETIVLKGSRNVEFFYFVQGERMGYEHHQPIQPNVYFVPSSANARMDPWPERSKRFLIENGIYNADGTVNMETAERLGWAQAWAEQEAEARARAVAAQAAESAHGKK